MAHVDDDSDFVEFGTALEPIEEDDASRKRPIAVSEQIAVDERGRRRFHGAFTGGFSAGYFNTVGSKEGWTPSTFKSSRSDRGSSKAQNVFDFMDDEDKGAFGIAPQVLRPIDDFTDKSQTKGRKRPWSKSDDGAIPGVPVLDQIIQPVKETVGMKILIKMGWRPGKGVGPKVQRKAKRSKLSLEEVSEIEKPVLIDDDLESESKSGGERIYGCSMPPEFSKRDRDVDESSDEDLPEELLAPDDVSALLCNPKENAFGLGYKGLDRNALTVASNPAELYGTKLKFRCDNKKMSISGQAFGVGAFEENDDDIYSREDMSQYDFALETPEERKRRKAKEDHDKRKKKTVENCIEGFRVSNSTKFKRKTFPPPPLPPNFQPFHATKKSRFEKSEAPNETSTKGLGRHSLQISERHVLIEDDINKIAPPQKEVPREKVGPTSESQPISEGNFRTEPEESNKKETDEDIKRRIERLKKFTQVLQAYSTKKPDEVTDKASFKPFMKNPEKQERYEKYLTLLQAGFSESLKDLQPQDMTEWERDREKMEFERASKLYKPMNSILASRFVSAKSHDISHLDPEKEAVKEKDPKDDPKVAARLKMYGKLTHRVMEWHPDKLVCKRFNIPHPFPNSQFVGVKGDPSVFARSSKVSNQVLDQPNSNVIPVVPKKSLFENLDFSKPPPGLLPPGTEPMSEGQMDTDSGTAKDENLEPDAAHPKPLLAFQKEISNSNDSRIVGDDNSAETERPPLDLFREIFADSSESEDEEPVQNVKEKNNDNSEREVKDNDRKSASSSEPTKNDNQRRIFDRIDLDKLRHQVPNREEKKDFQKEEEDEDMEDLYGPLPPTHEGSSSSLRSTVVGNVSSARPLFKLPRKDQDELKDLNSEEIVWVEKSAIKDEKGKKRSSKKSKKKSSKKSKHKNHKKEKKHKKKSRKSKHKGKNCDGESSSQSDDDFDSSSDSDIKLNDSINLKMLQAKLKEMTKQ